MATIFYEEDNSYKRLITSTTGQGDKQACDHEHNNDYFEGTVV